MELLNAALADVPMLVARGAIDEEGSLALREALEKLIGSGFHVIFLDLSDVTRMDDAGVVVLQAAAEALRRGGWVGAVGPTPEVKDLLESARLLEDPNFRVFENRQAARTATGDRAST